MAVGCEKCCLAPTHLLAAQAHDGERSLDERHQVHVLWISHLAQLHRMLLHHTARRAQHCQEVTVCVIAVAVSAVMLVAGAAVQ